MVAVVGGRVVEESVLLFRKEKCGFKIRAERQGHQSWQVARPRAGERTYFLNMPFFSAKNFYCAHDHSIHEAVYLILTNTSAIGMMHPVPSMD
jgi:hypothetical protein